MKPRVLASLTLVLAVGAGLFLFYGPAEKNRSDRAPAVTPMSPSLPGPELQPTPSRSPDAANSALAKELAAEKAARIETERELERAKQQLRPLEGQVVVKLGKVEDIGHRTGRMLVDWGALEELSKRAPATLTAEEKSRLLDLHRKQAEVLGMLPEIAAFQDRPDEYGRFFRSLVEEAAGLTESQATQVQEFMRQRAIEMNRAGLNNGNEPKNPVDEEAWEERRDEFNERTAEGLKGIIPADALARGRIGSSLLELLENDFDKFAASADSLSGKK